MPMLQHVVAHKYRLALSSDRSSLRSDFGAHRCLVMPHFFQKWFFVLLVTEVNRLTAKAKRRDLVIPESDNTVRRMSTLGSRDIGAMSSLVPILYNDISLLRFLSNIASERLLIPPDVNERYVLNCLTNTGDEHGTHTDTYSYAFNILLHAPRLGDGGVTHVFSARDKGHSDTLLKLVTGDAYFLYSKLPHCVSPLLRQDKRILLNFAYRSASDSNATSYSSSVLYG